MKLPHKIGHFTLLKSFTSTSCCLYKFPPNNIYSKSGELDEQDGIWNAHIGVGGGDRIMKDRVKIGGRAKVKAL